LWGTKGFKLAVSKGCFVREKIGRHKFYGREISTPGGVVTNIARRRRNNLGPACPKGLSRKYRDGYILCVSKKRGPLEEYIEGE